MYYSILERERARPMHRSRLSHSARDSGRWLTYTREREAVLRNAIE